jgi:hypothetical protein
LWSIIAVYQKEVLKMAKKHRSPAYPQADLKTVVELLVSLYPKATRHPIGAEVLAQEWNYKSVISASPYIAAAKHFGLLTEERAGEDRMLKMTERAKDIASDPDGHTQERAMALKAAAIDPVIFREMWEKWGKELPPDREIQRFLEREREFNPKYVPKVIENYKDTLAFAKLAETDEKADNESEQKHTQGDGWGALKTPSVTAKGSGVVTHKSGSMIELPVTLPSLNIAIVRVPAKMSELDYNTLVASLTAWKAALVKPDSPTVGVDDDDSEDEDMELGI